MNRGINTLGAVAAVLATTMLATVSLPAQSLIETLGMNSAAAENSPDISDDGRFIVFQSSRPGGAGREDIYLYDRTLATLLPLSRLNSPSPDFAPSISGDGRYIAFTSIRSDGAGQEDVYLFDRQTQSLVALPNLNSRLSDSFPIISSDGRFIIFESPDGRSLNIYIYDRQTATRLAPPPLNTSDHENLLGASNNGRFIGFGRERPSFTPLPSLGEFIFDRQSGSLERLPDGTRPLDISSDGRYVLAMTLTTPSNADIHLYDRQEKSFLPLPGLNSSAIENSARMSGDLRYIVFVTFRNGLMNPDVLLYDRGTRSLAPLPVANAR